MSDRQATEKEKRVERNSLEGLERMYYSGCLTVLFPEEGETFKECIETIFNYPLSVKFQALFSKEPDSNQR